MTSKQKSLLVTAKGTATTPTIEHILNALKAGLSTAPFCGGLASLMTDYIPSTKQKRLEEFTKQIAADLEDLQEHVDENTLLTDDFAFMFEKCFRGVAENYQAEKLEAFRGILVNSAIGFNASQAERECFVNLISSLSGLHLRILKFMAVPLEYLRDMEISPDRIRGGFSSFFPVAIPGVNIEVIKSAFGDLYKYGFIGTDKSIFETMTSGQGLSLLGGRVTQLVLGL
jgi:hypothetical protein